MTKKIKLGNYLNRDLILVNQDFKSSDELFEAVHHQALDLGYVREDFLDRIKARERTFPTGLQLETLGAAIPHTDAECIKKEFVAIVTSQPVPFVSMEDFNQSVEAEIAFVLGLSEPHAQLEMLQSLMGLLQSPDLLSQLRQADSAEQLITIINQNNI